MNKDRVRELLNAHRWTWAATYANKHPHWYTRLSDWDNRAHFIEVVRFIKENSVERPFYSKTFLYYYDNGYKYWTMDPTIESTDLINRTMIPANEK